MSEFTAVRIGNGRVNHIPFRVDGRLCGSLCNKFASESSRLYVNDDEVTCVECAAINTPDNEDESLTAIATVPMRMMMLALHAVTRVIELDVWVCDCCALIVNNGDESSCRDFHGHTHPTCDKNIVRADIEPTYEVGYFDINCNGCGSLVRNGDTLHAATRQLTN